MGRCSKQQALVPEQTSWQMLAAGPDAADESFAQRSWKL